MKRFSLLIFLFLILSAIAAADDPGYSIRQSVFLPPRYYVGDKVELRLRLLPASPMELTVPDKLPSSDVLDIQSLSVKSMGAEYEIILLFSPYATGRQSIPPLDLGDVTLRELKINTMSLLQEEPRPLQPPRDQLRVPSTTFIGALVGALVLILPILSFFLYRFGRENWHRLRARYQESRPRRQMIRHLKNLRAGLMETDPGEFYSRLSIGLRRYLTMKLGRDCNSATTRELPRILGAYLPPDLEKQFYDLFLVSDQVKFASRETAPDEQVSHLRQCLQAVLMLEGKESMRVDL